VLPAVVLRAYQRRDVIEQVAADLGAVLDGETPRPYHPERYPPW
jgi:hypothetical protein